MGQPQGYPPQQYPVQQYPQSYSQGYPQSKNQLTSCALCVKYLLFVMNFLFFAIGCATLGLGIWILKERNYMSALVGNDLMTAAAWSVIIGGGIIAFISFIGCIGAIAEQKCMIICYFTIVLLIFLIMVIGGVLALIFRAEIGEEVKTVMKDSITKYYGVNLDDSYNRAITDAWDNAQERLYCCAAEDQSWATYKGSEWYKMQPGVEEYMIAFVPPSCCVYDIEGDYIDLEQCQTYMLGPPGKVSGGETNTALFYDGCYYAGKDFIHEYTAYLAALGIGIGLLMIVGMVFAVILFQQLRY